MEKSVHDQQHSRATREDFAGSVREEAGNNDGQCCRGQAREVGGHAGHGEQGGSEREIEGEL